MNPTIMRTSDVATCQALRRTVFTVEQGVSTTDEIDGRDQEAIHLLALDGTRPVGTARILVVDGVGKIGRVCVLREMRGCGLGAALIRATLDELRTVPGVRLARLGAQIRALDFYARLGFTAHGPVFDDAGIAHRMMDRAL